MERKYPSKMFWLFVLSNFVFHFFYLFVPGIILCIVGIRVRVCLWIGLAILGFDLILSLIEQMLIRKAAVSKSDNPEFNEMMDAFCGPGGIEDFRKVFEQKPESSKPAEEQEDP